jgi:amidophosphoribosyltransferase
MEGRVADPREVCSVINGAPLEYTTVLALTSSGEIVVSRASSGLRTMHLGSYGFDLALLSNETPGISIVGGSVRRSLRPGEVMRLSRFRVRSTGGIGDGRFCALELIYISRNDSQIDGISTYGFRVELAERLASRIRVNVDSVVGVPDTGLLYGVKLAQALGRPADLSLVMTERRRSALIEDQLDRMASVQLKASPVVDSLRGRRVLLVDDSLISGLTIKTLSQLLRHRAGAREIHVAIASPRIVRQCPYGVNMPSEEYMLSNVFSDEEITRIMEVDSVTWLEPEDLEHVGEKFGIQGRICMECFLAPHGVNRNTR